MTESKSRPTGWLTKKDQEYSLGQTEYPNVSPTMPAEKVSPKLPTLISSHELSQKFYKRSTIVQAGSSKVEGSTQIDVSLADLGVECHISSPSQQ